MQHKLKIAFIGCGNMASALIEGICNSEAHNNYEIIASDPTNKKLELLKTRFNINITTNNITAVKNVDVIILSVKPQIIQNIVSSLKDEIQSSQLIISIAAGISLDMLTNWLDGYKNIICAMPNLPAAINAGVTGLYSAKILDNKFKNMADEIFSCVGKNIWLNNEELMPALAAVSGSGPAFVFYLIEALENAAKSFGFTVDAAKIMALQTFFGGAKMALNSEEDVITLRKQVTSPQGTTERLIAVLDNANIKNIVTESCQKAIDRFNELSK